MTSQREGTSRGDRATALRTAVVGGIVVSCAAAAALALGTFSASVGTRRFLLALDFRAYYTAGGMVLGGVRADLYDLPTQYLWQHRFAPEMPDISVLMPFLNPPFLALALAPLAVLPLQQAYMAWAVLNLALLAVLGPLLINASGHTAERRKVLILAAVLTYLPVWLTVMQGQVSLVLVLAMLGSWGALCSGRDFRAGLWLALALVRPQVLLMPAAVLCARRRWQALAGLMAGSAPLVLASFLLVGWDGLQGYVRVLVAASSWGDAYTIHPQRMHTWRGFVHLLLGTDRPADVQIWWLLGVMLALGLVAVGWSGRWDTASPRFDLQWALLTTSILFVSPHANAHDLSLLLVPGVLVLRYLASQHPARAQRVMLSALPALGYIAVPASLLWSASLHLQITVLFMLVAMLVLAWAARGTDRGTAFWTSPTGSAVR